MKLETRAFRMLALLGMSFVAQLCSGVSLAQEPELARIGELQDVARVAFTFEGTVYSPDGNPAVGAVVVSTAGGQAVTDEHGEYRIETRVAPETKSLEVTAVSSTSGRFVASQHVQLGVATGSLALPSMQLAQTTSCDPSWLPTFGSAPGTLSRVLDLEVFDDGNGPRLFAVGDFFDIGAAVARSIAKWDGSCWSALGGEPNARAQTLTVFDDGSGPALFVGGIFTEVGGVPANRIAKWDGANWSALGAGRENSVRALHVFDDGTGSALYVGTRHLHITSAGSMAKWDGSTWTQLGSGLDLSVSAMATFDDGSGDALFVGGNFTQAGGAPAQYIAKWDGAAWSPLGAGREDPVNALAVFDDGSGPALYAGSDHLPGADARVIAKWDGATWSPLGTGVDGTVHDLIVYDDGGGPALFVGGDFTNAGGSLAGNVAKWDGSSWIATADTLGGEVFALAGFDDGNGARLFAAGDLLFLDISFTHNIAQWDASSWTSLGSGLNREVAATLVYDDGSGPALYVGGEFSMIGNVPISGIAKWDGLNWMPLGVGVGYRVLAMAVFDDGGGDALYVGGIFNEAGGVPATNLAKWNGTNWSTVGGGVDSIVSAMTVYDDGSGPALFVGGWFTDAGGVPANRIAKWDGASWSSLGVGTDDPVYALDVYDDGTGEQLYVGGSFFNAGGTFMRGIASWDGTTWAPLASGVNGFGVRALATFDDGTGEQLIAAGSFTGAGGPGQRRIAKWDGTNWSAFGSGLNGTALSLAIHDDGTGSELFVGGVFSDAGGAAANSIAKWNGSNWAACGGGVIGGTFLGGAVQAMAIFDDGAGSALFVGGDFSSAPNSKDSYIAKWGCSSVSFTDFCNGDGGDGLGCTNCPCTNDATPGTVGGCLNSALSSARLIASGNASVSLPSGNGNDLRFSINSAPANAFCILNSGDAVAPTGMANPCFGLGSGVQALQFDGLRCAVVNTRRHGGRSADSNGDVGVTNSPWGGEGGPPVGIAQQGAGFVAGQTRYFQVINRDDPLAQCMRGLNTSQAVEVVFEP